MTIAEETAKLKTAIANYGDYVKGQVKAVNDTLDPVKGAKGNALFFTKDQSRMAIAGDDLLKKITLVHSDAEMDQAKGASVDFASVFNSWKRISHTGVAARPAVEAELQTWAYDAATNKIKNLTNSASMIGLISPEKYGDYVFEVDVSSGNADDDLVGLIAAYAEVDGIGHTLNVWRTCGGMGFKLFTVAYNYPTGALYDQKDLGSKHGGLKWSDGVVDDSRAMTIPQDYIKGWNAQGTGCRIRVVRQGDILTIDTSNMNENNVYVPTARVVVDLASDPLLAKFKGAAQIGYAAYSQADSTWSVLQAPSTKYNILDSRNNHVWVWQNGVWVDSGYVSDATLVKNRLYKNTLNGASYYCDSNGQFILLGSPGLGT